MTKNYGSKVKGKSLTDGNEKMKQNFWINVGTQLVLSFISKKIRNENDKKPAIVILWTVHFTKRNIVLFLLPLSLQSRKVQWILSVIWCCSGCVWIRDIIDFSVCLWLILDQIMTAEVIMRLIPKISNIWYGKWSQNR